MTPTPSQSLPGPVQESAWRRLSFHLHGSLSLGLIIINTLFWFTFLLPVALLKWLIPIPLWRRAATRVLTAIAESWAATNNFNIQWSKRIRWNIVGAEDLKRDEWYLVIANHQSWTDIVVLQKALNRRIPYFKFFLKKELIWVPLLGVAWWALDYPFMKRYSKAYLAKHPERAGADIAVTRKACERFRNTPVSIMNFVEGTRFTRAKHALQQSPFANLLRPKAGGVGYVLSVMGGQIHRILNVTIVYPHGRKRIWDFLCGKVREITVRIQSIPITAELAGDYLADPAFRESFQAWLNQLWAEKDRLLTELSAPNATASSEA